jgi:hypothetical protein
VGRAVKRLAITALALVVTAGVVAWLLATKERR